MSVGDIITYIMLVFAVIGGIDRAIGSKFGPGQAFERGFGSMGALVLAMVGPMAAAPLISAYLAPVLTPVFRALGMDPSIVAGMLLPCDAGGWPLATALAQDELLGKFSGSVVAAIMGNTITGSLPACFLLTPREKRPLIAKGITIGFITIPFGCFIGGLCYGLPLGKLLLNILPQLVLSVVFILGLTFFEKQTVKTVTVFGNALTVLVTLGLVATMVIKVLKLEVPNLVTFDECIIVIGSIAVFLSGAFTLLYFVERIFKKPLAALGKRLGLEEQSVLGLITTAVNAIPTYTMTGDMSDRGVIVNIAFLIPASYALGDHLAFQAAVDTATVVPMIVGKLLGGVLAVALALFLTGQKKTIK